MLSKNLKVFIAIMVAAIHVNAQKYSSLIPDREITGFIKQLDHDKVLNIHKVDPKIFRWNLTDPTIHSFPDGFRNIDSCKKYLSQADLDFIGLQIKSQLDTVWNKNDLKKYLLVGPNEIKEIFKKSQTRQGTIIDNYYYRFCIPLFNKKKDVVIINYTYACGFMCATQCNYLFKKENGKWNKIKEWNCWDE